ncbi:class I SAM-dependent methyltransferase [Sphingomonas sp. PWP1-2]|uniref:class I SAM-dependent methyltransferase n=1 Tax=Sphingomonas sp. PWP1-2 TaxID=2804558 RepID=UPI003CF924CE
MADKSSDSTDRGSESDIHWFHSFAFPDGSTVDGIKSLEIQRAEADLFFESDLAGKSVLDIGAWDGFFSFEAERRGAARVLATDHFCWSGPGWGTRDGFDFAHRALDSNVESLDIDVPSLEPAALGQFDVVLFLGVLYHVKDPYGSLEAAARMCSDQLIIETVTALHFEALPAMRLYKPGELGGDPTNFWAPNVPALKLMLNTFGFSRVEAIPSPVTQDHPLSRPRGWGFETNARKKANHRTIIRAWR